MLRASLYITLCTAKNRLLMRLRRLREPRYLIFAIAGAAYMYFAVFMRFGAGRRGGRRGPSPADLLAGAPAGLIPSAAGMALLVLAAVAWAWPARSTLFDLSAAEIHLLVPAPVSRRALLIHRLLRSQSRLLFGAFIVAFFVTSPGLAGAAGAGSNAARFLRLVAVWIVFVTVRVYFAGVTLARARLMSPDRRARRAAWTPIAVIAAAIAMVGLPAIRSWRGAPFESLRDLTAWFGTLTAHGLPHLVLWPFVTLIRPVFGGSVSARLAGLAGALIPLFATVVWVLHSDEVFHATSEDQPRDSQPRVAGPAAAVQAREINWPLGPSGSTEAVFFWKNGMESLRSTKLMAMLPFLIPLIGLGVAAATGGMSLTGAIGPAAGLSIAAFGIAAIVTLMGPQSTRSDMRGDLRHLALLKTWPVKGAAVVRGELSWPLTALTLVVWFALACGTVISAAAFPAVPVVTRWSFCGAAFLLAPAIIVAQLLVHNGAAVLLPGWVQIGKQRSRGLDAVGQRLILLAGVMLALVLVVGPGALAGGIVAWLFYRWIGAAVAVPAAALCLVVVAMEVLLATEALGAAYERIDLSAVEPTE